MVKIPEEVLQKGGLGKKIKEKEIDGTALVGICKRFIR